VQRVDAALLDGQFLPARGLDRADQPVVLAFVAQIGQRGVVGVGVGVQRGQQLGMGAGAGGVVLAAGPHVGGPQRPPVGRGDHLDVAAVVMVLARPPQGHPGVGPSARDRSVRISAHPRMPTAPSFAGVAGGR
jgi:hypothetical protein